MGDKIKTTILKLDEIYFESKKLFSSFNNKSEKSLEKILGFLVLERILGNLNSTRILLSNIKNNYDIEPSIGLILRNNLYLSKVLRIHTHQKKFNHY